VTRLTNHVATGKILEGWKFAPLPDNDVEGEKDFPNVRFFVPSINEKAHKQLAIVAEGSLIQKITISTKREAGVEAHITDCSKVMDAIEIDPATMTIDILLGATLKEPPEMRCGEPSYSTLSFTSHLTVTMTPIACRSGGRR
jgi:hypothetical protein